MANHTPAEGVAYILSTIIAGTTLGGSDNNSIHVEEENAKAKYTFTVYDYGGSVHQTSSGIEAEFIKINIRYKVPAGYKNDAMKTLGALKYSLASSETIEYDGCRYTEFIISGREQFVGHNEDGSCICVLNIIVTRDEI